MSINQDNDEFDDGSHCRVTSPRVATNRSMSDILNAWRTGCPCAERVSRPRGIATTRIQHCSLLYT
ncbi:hypothetical protein J6590_069047 [Homalodisca vitripennis]|nr:hypothetical protein J6590_069047 [Homalodisca vitripennis]